MQPTALFLQLKEQIGTATLGFGRVKLDGKESVIDYCQRTGTRAQLLNAVREESTLDRDPHVFTLVRTISFKDSAMNSFILDKTCRVC